MTIILTGGGSGGHITPILAIAEELKKIYPAINIIYIGQKGDNFSKSLENNKSIDKVFKIRAGKYRRYYKEGLKQAIDLKTFFLNIRDLGNISIGIIQSRQLIKKIKPEVVFSRGGYISVPVAMGARFNNVPYMTHDSDMVPSLANKLIAKNAQYNLVSFEVSDYPYEKSKIINTGIPINTNFKYVNNELKNKLKKELGLDPKNRVLLVVGGGLGSIEINKAITTIASELFDNINDLYIFHIAGQKNMSDVKEQYQNLPNKYMGRVEVFGFIDDLYKYSGAADLIIARAGATNIAEFAAQAKACLIIPSKFLVGGHQLKNAQVLKDNNAAAIYDEDNIDNTKSIKDLIISLINDRQSLANYEKNIYKLARVDAAKTIADLIIKTAKNHESNE